LKDDDNLLAELFLIGEMVLNMGTLSKAKLNNFECICKAIKAIESRDNKVPLESWMEASYQWF